MRYHAKPYTHKIRSDHRFPGRNDLCELCPEVFYGSMGFAKFFGPQQTVLLHRVLISGAFAVPLLFMLGCFLWHHRKKRTRSNIPLACLKLSLVVFYNFLDIPYLYLFYTSSFVSLIAITYFMLEKTDEELRVNKKR